VSGGKGSNSWKFWRISKVLSTKGALQSNSSVQLLYRKLGAVGYATTHQHANDALFKCKLFKGSKQQTSYKELILLLQGSQV